MAGKLQIQESFQKVYDLEVFKREILNSVFTSKKAKLFREENYIDESNQLNASEKEAILKVVHYGNLELDDYNTLKLYEITLQPKVRIEQSKVGIQQYVRKMLIAGEGVLVNFINPDNLKTWRLTLVASDTVLTDKGISVKKLNPKRYTFIVGQSEKCKTITDRFADLEKASRIVLYPSENEKNAISLVNIFSVETLSKAFFDEYTLHYKLFTEYLQNSNFRKSIFNITIPQDAKKEELDIAYKPIRDFTKKLLGRIVFLYFVQKKGWLGATDLEYKDGDPDFIFKLFMSSGANETFYELWLKNLFFDTLNKGGIERPNDVFVMPDKDKTEVKIPFLNGGLFDKEDFDNKLLTFTPTLFHSDDFEDVILTDKLFKKSDTNHRGFLDFLNAFNFTVHEDSPEDHTVAVDPEMLGHIFENLLEDNKDKGAFYTPKEIVHYMCQESLIEYLKTHFVKVQNFDKVENELADLVKNKEIKNLSLEQLQLIDNLLNTVKICDPAIGSGAFPMGLLQEIFAIKELIAFETSSNWEPAKVKENIIQNSIYGVDIEKGAVDIARLRFWLSLIVNEEKPKALPNLDYKIVVGDSLLSKFEDEIIEINWDKTSSVGKADEYVKNVQRLLKEVAKKQKDYFNEEGKSKKAIAAEIRDLKIDLLINQLSFNKESYTNKNSVKIDSGLGLSAKDIKSNTIILNEIYNFDKNIKKLTALRNDASKPFNHFDWKLDFPEVLNPLLANQNHEEVEIVNHQINSLNHQIEAINSYLKKNNFDELLLSLQANVAQEQAIIIKEQLNRIENKIAEIYGNIKSVDKNIVSEPNESILYTINALNKNIEDINHKIESINDKVNFGNEIGFDIVIGNPPYGAKLSANVKLLFKQMYSDVHMRTPDTFNYFISKSFSLLAKNGILSNIVPNNLLYQGENTKTRELLLNKNCLKTVVNLGDNAFENADVPTCIFFSQKNILQEYSINFSDFRKLKINQIDFSTPQKTLLNSDINEVPDLVIGISVEGIKIMKAIEAKSWKLDEIALEMASGISTGGDKIFRIEKQFAIDNDIEIELLRPVLVGGEIDKYKLRNTKHLIIYTDRNTNLNKYKNTNNYLFPFKAKLLTRSEAKTGVMPWFSLNRQRYPALFEDEKIIMRQTSDSIRACFDASGFYCIDSILVFKINPQFDISYKFALTMLNSKLNNYVYKSITQEEGRTFAQVKPQNVRKLFIPKLDKKEQIFFENICDYLLFLNEEQNQNINKLTSTYFEQIIDGMVYELYFPELLKQHNRTIIEHLGELPAFTDSMNDNQKMEIINTVFNRMNEKNHPVRVNLFYMKAIPEIILIEGIKE